MLHGSNAVRTGGWGGLQKTGCLLGVCCIAGEMLSCATEADHAGLPAAACSHGQHGHVPLLDGRLVLSCLQLVGSVAW